MAVVLRVISAFDDRAIRGAQRSLENFGGASKKFGKMAGADMIYAGAQIERMSKKADSLGRNLTRSVTLPVVGLGAVAVKSFADFEGAMTKSTSIMGDVSEETRDRMEKAARDVAKTMSVSHKDAAESYYFLASAGMDAEQSIAALPQVAAFAQAGMFDMATATDLATDAQSALGLAAKDPAKNLENLTRVTDVFTKASTLSNATIEQFSIAVTNKAGTAMKKFDLDMETGVAALAVFADKGVKGEAAGTMFSATLEGMAKNAINNEKHFKKLNIAVFDSKGKMRDTNDVIADMEKAFDGMSDKQRTATLMKLGFNKQALDGIGLLLGSSKAMGTYEKGMKDAGGMTAEVADKQMASFTEQLKLLKDQFLDVAIDVAPIIIDDFLKPLMGHLQDLAGWLQELTPEQRKMGVGMLAIAAAGGPALRIIGLFGGVIGGTIKNMGYLRLAFTEGGKAAPLWARTIAGAATGAKNLAVSIATGTANLVRAAAAWIADTARKAANTAVTLAHTAAQKAAAMGAKVWAAGQWLLNAALTANPIGLVVVAIGLLVGAVVLAWKNSETFRNVVTAAWAKIKETADNVFGWLKTSIPAAFKAILDFAMKYSPLGFLITNWGTIRTTVANAADKARELAVNAFNRLKDGAIEKAQGLLTWVTGLPGRITSSLGNLKTLLKDAGIKIITGLWDGLKQKWEDAKKWVKGIGPWIADNKGPKAYDLTILQPAGRWIMSGLITGIDSQMGALESKLREVSASINVTGSPGAGLSMAGAGGMQVSLAAGAVVVQLPQGATPREARELGEAAGEGILSKLADAYRRV